MASDKPTRWILHADMDAFYASIEQRDRPELKGRPVIVGATSARGVVAAASYEARRFGVHSAMPGFKARELCPQGIFLPADMKRYAKVSSEVREVLLRFTSQIEPLALDEAFLDISGSLSLFGAPRELAQRLKDEVRAAVGLNVSVGVGPSKLVAKIACTLSKPDGLAVVEPSEVRGMLDPLPVRRLWGIGPVVERRLAELNIGTVRELRTYDPEWLRRLLGDRALELQARARGEDQREVEVGRAPKSYGEENTFLQDVSDSRVVIEALTAHSETIARRLRRDGWVGRVVTVKIKLARRREVQHVRPQHLYPLVTHRTTLGRATDEASVIERAAVQLWQERKIEEPVRLVGLSVSGLGPAHVEQLGLFLEGNQHAKLGPTLDAIQRRFGESALRRGPKTPEKVTPTSRIKRGE